MIGCGIPEILVSSDDEDANAESEPPEGKMSSWGSWTLFEGGQQCIDFASYGLQRCLSGPTSTGFYTFVGLVRRNLPKLWITEITVTKVVHEPIGSNCIQIDLLLKISWQLSQLCN